MEKNFNHEESLTLINEMIHRAQNNFQKEKMYSMIFWGYVVAASAILNCILIHTLTNPHYSFLVWLVIIPCAVVSFITDRQIDRKALVKTHIDKIGDMVWKGFGIGVFVFIAIIYLFAHKNHDFHVMYLINSIIMIFVGICEFISACIYRYKPWYWVAALFWIGAFACAFWSIDIQFIVLSVCMIVGFVIPGHLLNNKIKASHV